MIVRFSLALAGWILAGGASMPDGQGGRREVTETIVVLGPGGLLQIPPDVMHWGEVVGDEPVLNLDIFTPVREEYAPAPH